MVNVDGTSSTSGVNETPETDNKKEKSRMKNMEIQSLKIWSNLKLKLPRFWKKC